MRKITWISLLGLAVLWIIFSRLWQNNQSDNFKFSDRDKTMVFPTPKTSKLDPFTVTPTPTTEQKEQPTLEIKSSSDTSVIKF